MNRKPRGKGGALPAPVFLVILVLSNFLNYRLHVEDKPQREEVVITENPPSTSGSYKIANKHSYGFFQDIPDAEWREFYQKPAILAQHYSNLTDPNYRKEDPAWWIFFNWDPYFNCPHLLKVGGLGDGPKWTCDPERIAQVAAERREKIGSLQKSPADCLIYSVGSNGNYRFEDGLYELLAIDGTICEVHIFDPGDYDRPENVEKSMHYHNWGLKSSYSEEYQPKANRGRGKYLSFPEIQRELGHQDRTIDIFKIDCEGCEWYTYKDWVSADIRQILIETHELPELPSDYFDALRQNGFALFAKEVNSFWGKGKAAEWSYIKLHPDFFAHGYQ